MSGIVATTARWKRSPGGLGPRRVATPAALPIPAPGSIGSPCYNPDDAAAADGRPRARIQCHFHVGDRFELSLTREAWDTGEVPLAGAFRSLVAPTGEPVGVTLRAAGGRSVLGVWSRGRAPRGPGAGRAAPGGARGQTTQSRRRGDRCASIPLALVGAASRAAHLVFRSRAE